MTIKEIENDNKIDEGEFDNISRILLESFLIKSHHKSLSFIAKKEELLDYFTSFLEKYLQLHF
jgi:hypothetical protein